MDKQTVIRCFDAWAPDWDARSSVDSEKINRILDDAGIEAGVRVLDVACGTGVLAPFYLARGITAVLGVDISPEMCRLAREKLATHPQISILCADAETAPLPRRFDRCVIFNAFPHFADREGLLWNLRRALCPGGLLTVAHDRGRAALNRHHANVGAISMPLPPADELAALLRRCGYTPVRALETDALYLVAATLPESEESL